MNKVKVLFVCVHNSARSQMAEALLNKEWGDRFYAESAGLEPGTLNPIVIESLDEIGIDISKRETKSVFELYKKGRVFHYVIAVCDKTAGEKCPIFPGVSERIYWSFPDPAKLEGTFEEKLIGTRIIGDQIKKQIEEWAASLEFKNEEESEEE
jgi:arsenate reductase (thioredoxin)